MKVCGPAHLIQKSIEDLGVTVTYDVDSLIEWAEKKRKIGRPKKKRSKKKIQNKT